MIFRVIMINDVSSNWGNDNDDYKDPNRDNKDNHHHYHHHHDNDHGYNNNMIKNPSFISYFTSIKINKTFQTL